LKIRQNRTLIILGRESGPGRVAPRAGSLITGRHPAEEIIDMKLPRPAVFFGPRAPHEGVYYSLATNAFRIVLALITLALALWAAS
jgi:hypothetical protein